MRQFGHFLVRLAAMLVGLALAFPASAFFLMGLVHGQWFVDFFNGFSATEPVSEELASVSIVLATVLLTGRMLAVAGLPALGLLLAAEFLRLRGLASNLLIAVTIALAGAYVWTGGGFSGHDRDAIVALLAAAFVGGFVYWLVAGRRAGLWLDQP